MRNLFQNKKSFSLIDLRYLLLSLLVLGSVVSSFAQCPPNIDFEDGTFTGWTCWTGTTYVGPGNVNIISLNPTLGPIANRHTMLSSFPGDGLDPFGQFPKNCPNGSGHSIKLGNTSGGHEAEGVSYTFTIPAGQNQFDLVFHYAVVFQGPQHQDWEQPRLVIEVNNITDGVKLPCDSFNFFKSVNSPLTGFFLSNNNPTGTDVWCKNWSAASVKLDGYAGKTIQLFFKTGDCTFQAHFGYAYVDVNTECSSAFVGATFCPDDTAINVIAPFGYQLYTWYNNNFSQVLGNTQILHLDPPPLSGSIVKVVVSPYNGYGCVDTFSANLLDTLTIRPIAGRDTSFCNGSGTGSVRLGAPPILGLVYSWSPTTGLSDPNISNPIASPVVSTEYVLTVTHDGGGCLTTDTVNVNIVNLDTSLLVTGPANYCTGSGQSVILHVNPQADSIQWYLNGVPIPGGTQSQYNVSQSGDYYATLFSFAGCSFNTRVQTIKIYQSPVAGFNPSSLGQCYDGNLFVFVSTSSPPSGTTQYQWTFGDGATGNTSTVTHSYAAPGTYTVKMVISGDGGCADSSSVTVKVFPSTKAGFKINTANQCFKNNLFVFTDTSTFTSGSLLYNWDFGDGNTSTSRNVTHSYILPGTYSVTLRTDAGGGCTDQVSYNVNVYPTPVAGFTINKANQCNKSNLYMFTNTSTVYSGSLQYNWILGDGATANTPDVTHSYTRAGAYTVKMVAITPDGCADSMSLNINVYPNPTADFSVQPICINLPIPVINKTVNNTTSSLVYLWDFGNGQLSTAANPVYKYAVPGTYTVSLSVSSVQCPLPLDTKQLDIIVDAPKPGIIYPLVDAVILFPEPLKARSIGATAFWTPAVNLDNRYSYTPKFKGKDPQLYTIQLKTVTGCITIDTQYVKTHKKIEIYVPTVFVPGDGLNGYLRPLCMGIEKVNYFRIYDRWGKLLFQMQSDRPGWNGKTNNIQQEMQTVVWMIEAVDVDGNMHHRQGTTVLIR